MNGIDSTVRDAIERLNLTYIRALDRRDMPGWLATFDTPGSYVCIAKENEDRGLPIGYMLDDCYERLQDRVTQVTKIQPDAVEHYQPRHFTQLVDIQLLGPATYRVETHFTVNYTPADTGRTGVLATGASALVLAAGIGVLVGSQLERIVSPATLKRVAGIGFIAIGLWTLLSR